MKTRRTALLLLALALTACLKPPVTESLELSILSHGASVVAIDVALRDPSDYEKAPRIQQRLEAEARGLAGGTDPWSARLRRVAPESQRDVVDRDQGVIRGITRWAKLGAPEQLRELFRDTGVGITYAEGDGWAELTLVPDRPSRATSAQRQRVAITLAAFSEQLADYIAATKDLYDYLDLHPERARACLGELFSVPLEDETLTDEERPLVEQASDAIGPLIAVLDADPGEAYTLDEISRLVYDPFPAPMTITVPGPVVEREGFPGELGSELRIPMFSIWSAFVRLEDRWITPDPAIALWRHDVAETDAPFDLDGFLARRRRAELPPDAGEVRRAIEKQLRPESVYRVRWAAQRSSATGTTADSLGSAGSPA